MTKVQVRDVPKDVHAVLIRRAAAAGQSLQEYLQALLTEHASSPTVAEVMDRVRQRGGSSATAEDVRDVIRRDRDRR